MLSRNVFWIVLIASAAMISDARTARAFQMPIRCPFYAPNGDIVRCADYQAFANAHREYQSAKGHAGSWGCRAISGTVGGRTWGMASRAEAASGANSSSSEIAEVLREVICRNPTRAPATPPEPRSLRLGEGSINEIDCTPAIVV